MIGIFFSSSKALALDPISFLSKSVLMSLGVTLASVINLLRARSRDEVRFFSGYIFLKCVALSTHIKLYLMPPIAVVGPKPISRCHISLYSCFVLDGLEFLFLDDIVDVYPSSESDGTSLV